MRSRFSRSVAVCGLAAAIFVASGIVNVVQPSLALTNGGSIAAFEVPLTEDFNSLISSSSATWVNDSTIPGWYTARTGTGTTIVADTGASNAGNLYSYGSAGSTDRALGSLGSGGASAGSFFWGVKLTNNTGSTITSVTVSYAGEQWRNGGGTGLAQTVDFQYQATAPGVITGINTPATGWVDYDALDFTSPTFSASASALDGNAVANRVLLSATIPVTLGAGQELWLRWKDIDHPSNDHGLAIDDFSVTAHGAAVVDTPPSVTSTNPAAGATGVALSSSIAVNFSESVTATSTAFKLECPAGAPQNVTQNPVAGTTATTITLTPSAPLPAGTTCSLTVSKDGITDTDGTPDHMTADKTVTFTTTTDTPPTVTTTLPATGATDVAVTSNVVINFSESVNATPGAFSIECPAGSPQTVTASASPAGTFTLTPAAPLPFATGCVVTVLGTLVTDTDGTPDAMVGNRTISFTTAAAPPPGAGIVMINEIDADTPGSDTAEFIELYDGGIGNTPLDGLVVVLYDGGLTPFTGNQVYAAFDLTHKSTDANGYFVLGNPGVPNVGLTFDPGQFGLLQNGPDAVALYIGHASDFPVGRVVTTANLLDAVVYGTDDPAPANLMSLINSGQKIVNEDAAGSGTTQSSQRCPNGMGGFRNTAPYYPGAPTPGTANNCPATRPPSDVVISQIYGGGGNSGATYRNDFVELYNRGAGPVDLSGWSLQYSPAASNGLPFLVQPIGGSIGAGNYYLIQLASGGAVGSPLPWDANIVGNINMAAGSGKVALVNSFDALLGGCPIYDPHIMDLVGYGTADCSEGLAAAPTLSSTTANFRKAGGAQDTDVNGNDFVTPTLTPLPRRTEPIVELGPFVFKTDPGRNGQDAPRDATIDVTFTEAVTVDSGWFNLDVRQQRSAQQRDVRLEFRGTGPIHHTERQLHGG